MRQNVRHSLLRETSGSLMHEKGLASTFEMVNLSVNIYTVNVIITIPQSRSFACHGEPLMSCQDFLYTEGAC